MSELKTYRLLAGAHEGRDYDVPAENGKFQVKQITRGGTIHSPTDLVKGLGSDKFVLVGDAPADAQKNFNAVPKVPAPPGRRGAAPTPTPAPVSAPVPAATSGTKSKPTAEELHEFTVEELKEMAADDEIDLHGCKTKAEIIDRMTGRG